MEHIERQAAIEALAEQIALCDKALNSFGISMKDECAVKVEKASLVAYKEQLEAIPAADVAPVVHSTWIEDEDEGYHGIHCLRCGFSIPYGNVMMGYNFCPNCGADMRGERDG